MLSHQQLLAALPSIALNLMLASVFAVTLRRGEDAFDRSYGGTRRCGVDAAVQELSARADASVGDIFAAMAGLSLLLMLYAPFEWWSLFVNVLTWPLIGVMFAAEWAVRRVAFGNCRRTHRFISRREFLPTSGRSHSCG
jgi:uncharacterized membrane protein